MLGEKTTVNELIFSCSCILILFVYITYSVLNNSYPISTSAACYTGMQIAVTVLAGLERSLFVFA